MNPKTNRGPGGLGARAALVASIALLVALFAFSGSSFGAGMVLAQESPSPTPTGPAGKPLVLLNPSPELDPVIVEANEPADSPNISDKYDGVDNAYHIVAVTPNPPANAVVETYWKPSGDNEFTVEPPLQRISGTDTWEAKWEIPASFPEGEGEFIARLYEQTAAGLEQVAEYTVPATLRHEGVAPTDPFPAEDTVELTWPTNAGPIGFYKGRTGAWRTVVDGSLSPGAGQVRIAYSTTPIGRDPQWTFCGTSGTTTNAQGGIGARRQDQTRPFQQTCALAGRDTPSKVTAIGAVAMEPDTPHGGGVFTMDSSDVHRVQPYLQSPSEMKVQFIPKPPGTKDATYPTGRRRTANVDCLVLDAYVTDDLDRPVQGANLDIHITGPDDQVGFGDEASSTSGTSSEKAPDKVHSSKESQRDCDMGDVGDARGDFISEEQGDHNAPGANDTKHIESTVGTGMSGPTGSGAPVFVGKFRFGVFSENPGRTFVTAWVDDEPLPAETETRPADDDVLEAEEPSGETMLQFLPGPMRVQFDPPSDSAPAGTCNRYSVQVRGGNAVVDGVNVDVHASGPTGELDFCDPEGGGTARSAPDLGDHAPEDTGEASHGGEPPVQHTEGETDENGNFVFGIMSPSTGDSTLVAWVDGELEQNNDVQESGEPSGSASKTWAASAGEANVRFVNPSGYGGSENISNKEDGDKQYHLVARVDAAELVAGVQFSLLNADGTQLVKALGEGTREGMSDTWGLFWPVDVPDGSYTLRAQITGTERFEDRKVTVNNTMETVELTKPLNATNAAFSKSATEVKGVASAGANHVDVYYTKTGAGQKRDSTSWIRCGTVALNASATAPQPFTASCKLTDPDQPSNVTGIAAVAVDCGTTPLGCDAPGGRLAEAGDAHRVFGFEANPLLALEPTEDVGQPGSCQTFTLSVIDQTGQPVGGANVDVHLQGPTDAARFCDPSQDGTPRRGPDQGGHSGATPDEGLHADPIGPDTRHTEGETTPGGKFVFGVISDSEGDTEMLAWVDVNDNDEKSDDEAGDTAVMHWRAPRDRCDVTGTARGETLTGTPGDDKICGGGGDDVLRGLGGRDVIVGGRGKDRLLGGSGNDTLKGRRAPDYMRGGSGKDTCFGGRGDDRAVSCERGGNQQ